MHEIVKLEQNNKHLVKVLIVGFSDYYYNVTARILMPLVLVTTISNTPVGYCACLAYCYYCLLACYLHDDYCGYYYLISMVAMVTPF
jgi:hypothetical protein